MTDDDYYIQLKLQIGVLQKILDTPQSEEFDWRYSVHKEICKLDHIIHEHYRNDYNTPGGG